MFSRISSMANYSLTLIVEFPSIPMSTVNASMIQNNNVTVLVLRTMFFRTIVKRNGDRASPCLSPLLTVKKIFLEFLLLFLISLRKPLKDNQIFRSPKLSNSIQHFLSYLSCSVNLNSNWRLFIKSFFHLCYISNSRQHTNFIEKIFSNNNLL